MSTNGIQNVAAAIVNHRRTDKFTIEDKPSTGHCPPFSVTPITHREFETSTVYLFKWRPDDSKQTYVDFYLLDEDNSIPFRCTMQSTLKIRTNGWCGARMWLPSSQPKTRWNRVSVFLRTPSPFQEETTKILKIQRTALAKLPIN